MTEADCESVLATAFAGQALRQDVKRRLWRPALAASKQTEMLADAQAMPDGLAISKAFEAVGICVDAAFRWPSL